MDHNLSLYSIFHTVATRGNISYAAKDLFISQPAISKALHKLEEQLGVILFHRSSRGVTLTDEGRLLFEYTQTAFDALNEGTDALKKMYEFGIGSIRIGVSTTLCKYILIPYLKEFIENYPHTKVTIECQSTFHTLKLLEDGKIDIGLIGKPDNRKYLDFFSVGTIQDTFVYTKKYLDNLKLREAGIDNNDFTIFNTANLMLLDEENITRVYIDQYFRNYNITPNQILEISNMDLLIEFAKIGLGVACVIKEFVVNELNEGTLIQIPLKNPIPEREIGFVFHKQKVFSRTVQNFIDFYKNSNV